MFELLKVDLKRFVKDKLFLVICIVAGAFVLFTPLLYKGLFMLIEAEDMLGMVINAKTLLFAAFSPSSDMGLILPILVALVLCKDFGQGTVRNKIICGKSRSEIFFSMLLTCTIVTCGVMFAYGILILCVSLTVFDYQSTPFTASDFGYLLLSLGFEILVYVFLSSLICFFIVFMKNAGLAIVMYFAVNFLFVIVGGIVSVAGMAVDPANTFAYRLLEILTKANVFMGAAIGNGTSYTLTDVLCILLPTVLGTVVLVLLGRWVFSKKDLK